MAEPAISEEDDRIAQAVGRVRDFAIAQLKESVSPEDLSFALAFISAEMGFHVTKGKQPLGVMRTVLRGLIAATASSPEGNTVEETEGAQSAVCDEQVPPGAILH